MTTSFDFSYVMDEGLALIPGLLSMIPSGAISIAAYILTAMALYTLAQRRGINHPWLSWVPVANVWILGSLSDQYRYVVKGEERSKRKSLVVLKIISAVIVLLMVIACVVMAVEITEGIMFSFREEEIFEDIVGPLLAIVGLALPLAGVSIACTILRFMALYDVYTSCDPQYNVLFLVLSILFGVTEPFFLFFSRNKDVGMPPRRQEPQYQQPQQWEYTESGWQPPQDPGYQTWEENNQ